jgi:esterase/lipase superfamily enzyme
MRNRYWICRRSVFFVIAIFCGWLTSPPVLQALENDSPAAPGGQSVSPASQEIQRIVREFLSRRLGIPFDELDPDRDLVDGLLIDRDVLYYELSALYDERQVENPVYEPRTIREIADYLTAPRTRDIAIDTPPPKFYVQKVYFATSRRRMDSPVADSYFDRARAPLGEITYGVAEVNIPESHKPGELESPLMSWVQRNDPTQHIFVLKISELGRSAFLNDISSKLAAFPGGPAQDLLVYVHGFNVSFDDAVRRAAQLAVDYGFKGAPVTFSWPSNSSIKEYNADWANVLWSVKHLESFLTDLMTRFPNHRIHIIAHSMGSMAALHALRLMAAGALKTKVASVILCAPDFDADLFKEQIASEVKGLAERWVIYSSDHDSALSVSAKLNGAMRLGVPVTIADGFEVVDASGIEVTPWSLPETHSYYTTKLPVIKDIVGALQGLTAAQRKLVSKVVPGGMVWLLRP